MTIAQKHEAVALGRVMGAVAAAEALGWDRRTVRGWMADAGVAPDLADPGDGWQSLHDLAIAKTTAAVASGKLPVRTVAVIAGIAARNLKPNRPTAVAPTPEAASDDRAHAAYERLSAWADSLPDGQGPTVLRYIRHLVDRELAQRDGDSPEAESTDMAEWWDAMHAWLKANLPAVLAESVEIEALAAARNAQRAIANRFLADEECDLLIQAETYLQQEIQP